MSKLDSGDKKAIMKLIFLFGLSLSTGFHLGHAVGLITFFSIGLILIVMSEN